MLSRGQPGSLTDLFRSTAATNATLERSFCCCLSRCRSLALSSGSVRATSFHSVQPLIHPPTHSSTRTPTHSCAPRSSLTLPHTQLLFSPPLRQPTHTVLSRQSSIYSHALSRTHSRNPFRVVLLDTKRTSPRLWTTRYRLLLGPTTSEPGGPPIWCSGTRRSILH